MPMTTGFVGPTGLCGYAGGEELFEAGGIELAQRIGELIADFIMSSALAVLM
jgi:hypothetical protein